MAGCAGKEEGPMSGFVVIDEAGNYLTRSYEWVKPDNPGPSGKRVFLHDSKEVLEGGGEWAKQALWFVPAKYFTHADYLRLDEDNQLPFPELRHPGAC